MVTIEICNPFLSQTDIGTKTKNKHGLPLYEISCISGLPFDTSHYSKWYFS